MVAAAGTSPRIGDSCDSKANGVLLICGMGGGVGVSMSSKEASGITFAMASSVFSFSEHFLFL